MFPPDVHRALVSEHRAALTEIARQERLAGHPHSLGSPRARAGLALIRAGLRMARVPADLVDGCTPSPFL